LLKLLNRWREEAEKAGRKIERIAVAFEAGRDGFWLARWLRARGGRRREFLGVSCMQAIGVAAALSVQCVLEGAQSFRTRTGLCPGPGIPPGKSLARPETGAPILATTADFGRQRPRSPADPPAKPRKVKDYSDWR
jgi:hypothetical protein